MAMNDQTRDDQAEEAVGDGLPAYSRGTADGVTRRRALQLGAVAAGTAAFAWEQSVSAAARDDPARAGWARERSFDEGWSFFRGDANGAEASSFDDGSWRTLDLPHDWTIEDLPYATPADGGATSDPSLWSSRSPTRRSPNPRR